MNAQQQETYTEYLAASRDHRHADVVVACTRFGRWAEELKADGVECPPDANGVRWSVDQIAELLT